MVAKIDIAIVGAGPAALAAAIGFKADGFSVAIAETSPVASAAAARGRSAALLSRTVAFLRDLGVWEACAPHAAPLKTLQFIDDTGRRLRAPDCAFSASEIGEEAFGYNIENADLAPALRAHAEAAGLQVTATGPLKSFERQGGRARVSFADGSAFEARLAIAADGKGSATREAAGMRALSWGYDQAALATAFSHERPHYGRCIEIHRRPGPFTLIPLPGNRSSLVWVETTAEAKRLAALAPDAFMHEVEAVSRLALGRISGLQARALFPLSSLVARDYGKNRVALAGEAAHAVPPIGAQGLNLGFRDVEALRGAVRAAHERGEDIGGDGMLAAYSAARRGDVLSRTLGIDALNRSLFMDFLPLQFARGAGLYALATIGPLRRAFMRRGIAPASTVPFRSV